MDVKIDVIVSHTRNVPFYAKNKDGSLSHLTIMSLNTSSFTLIVLLFVLIFCLSGNEVYAFGAGNIPRYTCKLFATLMKC